MNTRTVITMVAGVTWEGRQALLARMKGNEPVRLEPEPDNAFDKNAVAVWAVLEDMRRYKVGYLPRDLAAQVAPRLEGESVMCELRGIVGGFEKFDGTIASLGLRILVEYPIDEGTA